jgi:hypothetical protein
MEEGGDAAIAIPAELRGIANNGSDQPYLVLRLGGLIALGRTRLPYYHADPALRYRQSLPNTLNALPATGRA